MTSVGPLSSLRAKIYFGFGVLTILLVANSAVGYLGIVRLSAASCELQHVDDVNAVVLEIDRDIQALRLGVDRYIRSGQASVREDVVGLGERLTHRLKTVIAREEDPEVGAIFTQMAAHLKGYLTQFDTVVAERLVRAGLVREQSPASSDAIDGQLGRLGERIPEGREHSTNRVALLECQMAFSQAEKLLLRYYGDPDTRFVNAAVEALELAASSASHIRGDGEVAQLRGRIIADIEAFGRLSFRAVQATRSYLFLVNVVMAGEASEVAYYSRELRRIAEQRRAQIAARVASTRDNVRRATGAGIAIALLMALLIAGKLVLSIVPPITALTSAFQKLATGETLVSIPESERADEIGDMAQAARVFSDQNRQARELLAQSESLRQELSDKAVELETTNSELDSFAYVASHDLQSPLRGIRQLAEWLEEDALEHLPEASVRHLRLLQERVQKLEKLLRDLLDYSRVGRLEAEPEEVDVQLLLKDLVGLIDNPKRVDVRISEDLPTLMTVRTPLEQVFLNLIGNAIKHNDRESGGQVEVTWESGSNPCLFRVSDNGPGIDRKHHERAFQMYQRVGSDTVDGSGMGLAIVKKQVERMGGEIRLESELGGGAQFNFAWPGAAIEARRKG